MIALRNASTPEELEKLKRVLLRCREGKLVAHLKRFIVNKDGEYREMVIKESMLEGKFMVTINDIEGGFVYLDITCKRRSDINVIRNLWETTNKRGTQNFQEKKVNDYYLVLDIISEELERNNVYILSFMQPLFISYEGAVTGGYDYRTFNSINNVFYDVEEITLAEIEYEEELDKQANRGAYEDEDEILVPATEEEPEEKEESGGEEYIDGNQFLKK